MSAVALAPESTDVLGDGLSFVRLIGYFGDELNVANAARVSFHKESSYVMVGDSDFEAPGRLNKADQGLIRFLLKNKHGTPFEQGFMAQFHIRVPIFVMREWVRHRVGVSINEESGRYVEMRPDFYVHPIENIRTQKGKPGAYTFEPVEDRGLAEWWRAELDLASRRNFDLYRRAIEFGIAKEVARACLTLNLYTEFRWCVNARSLMNFLALRNSSSAMLEIRMFADVIEDIFEEHMPTTHGAFVEAGRVAP